MIMRTDWGDFPDVKMAFTEATITTHEHYLSAKAGDMDSALCVVSDFLNDSFLIEMKNFIKNFENIYVLPVHAEEMLGRNKIPVAFAEALCEILGLQIETEIVQATKSYRTQADGIGRLLKRVYFAGEVIAGRNYLIVDDVITQGGTLTDLKGYIETKGGHVVGASTLSGKPNSAKIALRKATLGQLRKQAGREIENWWQEQFGYDFTKLTESEARYLNKQIHRHGIDTVRNHLVTARLETSR